MNLSLKIIGLVVCLVTGTAYPLAFLGAAALAFSIWVDVTKDHNAPGANLQRDSATSRFLKTKDQFRAASESPAEEAFFDAMVEAFRLELVDGKMKGKDGILLDMQVEVLCYRLDFLVDKRLIVEIDGAAWHSSPDAQKRDRDRDSNLSELGYYILRIPAKEPLYSPLSAIQKVRDAREQVRLQDAELANNRQRMALAGGNPVGSPKEQLLEALRPRRLLAAVSGALDDVSAALIVASESAAHYREQAIKEEKEEQQKMANYIAELKQLRDRHHFSRCARLEEIRRCRDRIERGETDLNAEYEMIEEEKAREEKEAEVMKLMKPGYKTPQRHHTTVLQDLIRKTYPPDQLETHSVDRRPKTAVDWKMWVDTELRSFEFSQRIIQKIYDGKFENIEFPIPPIGKDIEAWRAEIGRIKADHFPYPDSLEHLESQRYVSPLASQE